MAKLKLKSFPPALNTLPAGWACACPHVSPLSEMLSFESPIAAIFAPNFTGTALKSGLLFGSKATLPPSGKAMDGPGGGRAVAVSPVG